MTTINLLMNTLAAANPYDPPPANFVRVGTVTAGTNGTAFARSAAGQQACWVYDAELTGDVVFVEMASPLFGSGTGNSQGVILYNFATNNGIELFCVNATTLTINEFTNGVMNTISSLATITIPSTSGAFTMGLRYTKSLSQVQVVLNGSNVGTPYGTTINNVRGGITAFSTNFARGVSRLTVDFTPPYSVDSINGSDPIQRGETGIAYTTSGFTTVTQVTTDTAGVTASAISDTSGDGTFTLSNYSEGGRYPLLPASVLFTLGDGTNSASLAKNITILDSESSVVTQDMIDINSDFLGYHFEQAGRSIANGGQIIWPTTVGLDIYADGSYSHSGAGDLEITLWYRDPLSGRMYEFNVTLSAAGVTLKTSSNYYLGFGLGIGF